jgi:hypothetical protein
MNKIKRYAAYFIETKGPMIKEWKIKKSAEDNINTEKYLNSFGLRWPRLTIFPDLIVTNKK